MVNRLEAAVVVPMPKLPLTITLAAELEATPLVTVNAVPVVEKVVVAVPVPKKNSPPFTCKSPLTSWSPAAIAQAIAGANTKRVMSKYLVLFRIVLMVLIIIYDVPFPGALSLCASAAAEADLCRKSGGVNFRAALGAAVILSRPTKQ